MIVTDDHMHIYNNLKLKALEQFKSAGGTHVFLVSLLCHHYDVYPKSGRDFEKVFNRHIALVEKGNRIVKCYAVLSVHPAEITVIGNRLGFERAAEIMKEALDLAGKFVEEGKAVAIKSGRPHYKVPSNVWRLSNEVMKHAFEVAKDVGCVVQLHTESYTREGIEEIIRIADEVGFKRGKIVKHFSPPLVKEFEELGIFPSVLASDRNVFKAAEQGSRFMLETDYIDDRKRPGAVLGPKTVPRKVRELLESGYDEDFIHKICAENVEKVYGVEL